MISDKSNAAIREAEAAGDPGHALSRRQADSFFMGQYYLFWIFNPVLSLCRDQRSPGKSRFMTSATKTTSRPTPKTMPQLSLLRACVWKMVCIKGI